MKIAMAASRVMRLLGVHISSRRYSSEEGANLFYSHVKKFANEKGAAFLVGIASTAIIVIPLYPVITTHRQNQRV